VSNAVITVVHGRHDHLLAQRRGLAHSQVQPGRHVVVAIDDPAVTEVVQDGTGLETVVVPIPSHAAGLPLAAARNAGARWALAEGAEVLVFLDVDCIPSPAMMGYYLAAARAFPGSLLSGPVTYLPPLPAAELSASALSRRRSPHPARPDPTPGQVSPGPADVFWSLSFAVTASTWRQAGGFYEGYVGYGAEDTDFARTAQRAGVELRWVGGADVYHQHHPVSKPPVEHVPDIIRNGSIFHRRHGIWPMRGWLQTLQERGSVRNSGRGWSRTNAPRVASIPTSHPYVSAVRPQWLRPALPARSSGWAPDPLFRPGYLRRYAPALDAVHLHFGFDHLTPAQLQEFLLELARCEIPLVYTLHDLRNPHHEDLHRHQQHLRLLMAAAAEVVTLTDAAAQVCVQEYGRRPRVMPHPTVLPSSWPPPARDPSPDGERMVVVALKALRRNVANPAALVEQVVRGGAPSGARIRVLLHPVACGHRDIDRLRHLHDQGLIELDVRPYLPEPELVRLMARAWAWVLPYRFGTHSGWVELGRDLGTWVIAPNCGFYAAQNPDILTYGNSEATGLDEKSLRSAVRAAVTQPRPSPASRAERMIERDLAQATHEALYERVRPARAGAIVSPPRRCP
jgi:GT2 family glycosyltransferase